MKRILVSLAPFILGSIASILLTALVKPELVLSFQVGLGMIVFIIGLGTSLIIFLAGWAHQHGQARAFQQAQENRRSFIRRLDHELKNPLTGLRAALANLSESAAPEDREQASLNARRDVERLQHLLADLRKLSDLDEQPLECLPVQVREVLEEIVEAAASLPATQGRRVSLLIADVPPLPPVLGDRDLLGLALYNLVDNALKFTRAGHAVQVRAREDGRSVLIEVADGGPGIPEADLPHLFEELYRGTNARGIPGSGLGLALAARIVDLHGGSLKVASRQGERGGTVFSLSLPAGRSG
jgi:two-component system, OmpR family, sensor kinase